MVGGGILGAIASSWRVSGILSARSGSRLNITSGIDRAFNGISAQRVNQVSDDIYGPGKDAHDLKPGEQVIDYLNRSAFVLPDLGTLGTAKRNLGQGPGFWQVDMALSKLVSVVGSQRLELRVEAFNLFNNFNWGNPVTNFNSSTFGRITSQAGTPRIMQFGLKYDF
jgi:hypothetical protein